MVRFKLTEKNNGGEEHRKIYTMTGEQVERVAEIAATKALTKVSENFFLYVGKGIVFRMFWIVGAAGLAVYFWLQSKGIIK
jgi:hypothetical protein